MRVDSLGDHKHEGCLGVVPPPKANYTGEGIEEEMFGRKSREEGMWMECVIVPCIYVHW